MTAENVHDAWAASRVASGNPHLVPSGELDEAARQRDEKYVRAIRLVSQEREHG